MATNPFDILGLPRSFVLEKAVIQGAYLARVTQLHPDFSASDPDADERSAQLNDARRVLLDPESRAEALLTLLAGPTKESHRSLPSGFLAEVLEAQENMEQDLATNDPEKAAIWDTWIARRIDEVSSRLAAIFAQALPTQADLLMAREGLNAWRYYARMRDRLPV